MSFPSRRARVALLAGLGTLVVAAPASAAPAQNFNSGTGELAITFGGTDNVEVATTGSNVSLNGDDTGVAASAVKTITVTEDQAGTGANLVDLSGVSGAAFTQLTGTTISARGGVDTLIGSQAADRILGGTQDDIMRGEGGDDTLVWNPGEGSDQMDGGNGSDTIENNGGDNDENFKASPLPGGGFKFERVSPAPFVLTTSNSEKLLNNMKGGNDTFTADLGLAALVVSTINGDNGDDKITGTDGNDTLNGGAGKDTIDGARGNDAMNGDDGDDLLIWNNGDGSDRFEGGAGNDIAQDNGAPAGDRFVVTANNGRVSAVRTNLGLFFLDIGSSETLEINGLAGDDDVEVGPGIGALTKVDIRGGDGNDTTRTRNDSAEKINGGAGTDSAVADATDEIAEVESADTGAAAPGAPAAPAAPGAPTAPATPAADRTGPRMAIVTKAVRVRGGAAAIRLSCPAGESRCRGNVRILRGRRAVGRVAFNLAGGKSRVVRVKLDRRTRVAVRRLRAGRALQARIQVTARDAAGNRGTATARLRLRR